MMEDYATQTSRQSGAQFLKVLVFWDLVVYGLAYISPVGPFSTWGYANALSGGAAPLSYALAAAGLFLTALSYSVMSREVPGSGSAYAYAHASMGGVAGFMTGWMVLFDYLMLPALMYVFFGVSMSAVFPEVPRWIWIVAVAVYNIAVNWFGIRTSARLNIATLIGQFVVLFVVMGFALYKMRVTGIPAFTIDAWWGPDSSAKGLFSAISLCVMAYLGFDAITTLSGEVRPEQGHLVGRAVLTTLALITLLAVLQVWIFADLAAGFDFKDLATATFEVLNARVDPVLAGATAVAGSLLLGVSITPNMVAAVSRILHSMARHGEMPKFLGFVHPKYRVPHLAILASGALSVAVALLFSENFDVLTSMVNFGALAAFIAVNAAVIAYFRWQQRSEDYLRHLVLPISGIAVLLAVISQMSIVGMAVGGTWAMIGFVVCIFLRTGGAKLVKHNFD
jgi:amino acid transporter